MDIKNIKPAQAITKKPFFLIRWGNIILLLVIIAMLLAGFPNPTGTVTQSEKAVYGYIYLACVAGLFALSIVRIIKKHHLVLSIIWILFSIALLYPAGMFWAPVIR